MTSLRWLLIAALIAFAPAHAGMSISAGIGAHTHTDANTGGATLESTTCHNCTFTGTTTVPSTAGTALVFISSQDASNSSVIDFTGLDSTYDEYQVHFTNIRPNSNGQYLNFRVSESASFKTDATGYSGSFWGFSSAGTTYTVGGSAGDRCRMTDTTVGVSNGGTHGGVSGVLYIKRPSQTSYFKTIFWEVAYHANVGSPDIVSGHGACYYNVNQSAVDGIEFVESSGTIGGGTFALYGVKKQ